MEKPCSIRAPIRGEPPAPSVEGMNIALALLAVGYVLYRQVQKRPVNEGRSMLVPLVITGIGLAQGGLVDPHHAALSVGLLAIETLAAAALALYRAYTVRIWREGGTVWRQGTWQTVLAWVVSIGLRVGLIAAGTAMGVAQSKGGIMVFLGLTLLVQNAVVSWRARSLPANARATVNA